MPEAHSTPLVSWREVRGRPCLYLKFPQNFDLDAARAIISAWKHEVEEKGEPAAFIWDCLEMDEYDIGARNIWQEALKPCKNVPVFLITEKLSIRLGARAISIFTGINIKVCHRLEDIGFKCSML